MNIYSLHILHGGIKLKIAITTEGRELNSNIGEVFGRSNDIIIIEKEQDVIKTINSIENPVKYDKGAGNLLGKFLVEQGIDVVISGEMGPIAYYILNNAHISVYKAAPANAEENLKRFTAGKLEEITSLSSGYPR